MRAIDLNGELAVITTVLEVADASVAIDEVWIDGVVMQAKHHEVASETAMPKETAPPVMAYYTTGSFDWPPGTTLSQQTVIRLVLARTPDSTSALHSLWASKRPVGIQIGTQKWESMTLRRLNETEAGWIDSEWASGPNGFLRRRS